MWDNAPLLRGIANALLVISTVAMLYGALHYMVHLPQLLPLKSVRLNTVPVRVMPEAILDVVRKEVHGNFFTVDIEQIRKELERLPWVRKVSVRREFPDSLAVEYEEHQPLARWNGTKLVNQQGEIFVAETDQDLPGFSGGESDSVEMTEEYGKFSQQLAVLDLRIKQLALSPRHAWKMYLSNDMVVELGGEAMQERLSRFIAVYPYSLGLMLQQEKTEASSADTDATVKFVDMRYRNGFAVRMRNGNS